MQTGNYFLLLICVFKDARRTIRACGPATRMPNRHRITDSIVLAY